MVANQYQLWDFSFVARIHRNIDLVRNNITGQLMVRRISPSGDFPVLQALCGIKHRNLMEVYDLRLQGGVCVSLCEYINGITLAFRVDSGQLFDVKSAKRILCQICDGLTALHSRGIVHRDIKPENIMITNDGTAKIIDYSICRLTKNSRLRFSRAIRLCADKRHSGYLRLRSAAQLPSDGQASKRGAASRRAEARDRAVYRDRREQAFSVRR